MRRRSDAKLDVALCNGLRLRALATRSTQDVSLHRPATQQNSGVPIRQTQASMIRQVMEQVGGKVSEAAQFLGMSRATLYRKLGHRDTSDN